jgi:MOSC domain-containing protein
VAASRSPSRRAGRAATAQRVGTIGELWRYPVKSMLGGTESALVVTGQGAVGDRAWALRDLESGRIASAKRFPRLLGFRAGYEVEPTRDAPGRVRILTPDGRILHPDEPGASEAISEILGHPLRLENRPGSDEKAGIDGETVFGDVPVPEMKPDWTPETMPDFFQLKSGSFLEIGSLFVLASGSVEHLLRLQGGTALIDRRRFRPNLYVDTGSGPGRFVEDEWLGRDLAVGSEVVLGDFEPTLWCVTSTLAQEELPRDPSVLRTAAQHHRGCLGVYCSVRSPGVVRAGDPVMLLDAPG